MKALLIVDLQNDFCPNGALPVPEGDKIVAVINKIMDKFDIVVASKDWHKTDTKHFNRWPPHCIEKTKGADFPNELRQEKIDEVFYKGTTNEDKGYSAFEAENLDLEDYLRGKKVDEIFLAGLALDYCVKETAKDAIQRGFKTYIVKDATKALSRTTEEETIKELTKRGVIFIDSNQL
ncbi:MAG: isochorismatase family protein [Proteobacteria bacterium]|nr:isochorismatase family protein [Pseudomonadota bacterium]